MNATIPVRRFIAANAAFHAKIGSAMIPMHGPQADGIEAAIAAADEVVMGGFKLGDRVRKRKGSAWHGRVVGHYSTAQTPTGICVESEREPGSVQLYPASAFYLDDDQQSNDSGVNVENCVATNGSQTNEAYHLQKKIDTLKEEIVYLKLQMKNTVPISTDGRFGNYIFDSPRYPG